MRLLSIKLLVKMPARPHPNPAATLSYSWSLSSPNDNAPNFSVDSYETSFDMDGPPFPLIQPISASSSNDGHQPELVEAYVESLQEITPDNLQPPSLPLYQYPSATPVKRRVASYRHILPIGSPNVPAREMGDYLAIELDRIPPIRIVNLPSIIFPDSLLPFPINEALVTSLGNKIWSTRRKVLRPPSYLTEVAVQQWLNDIAGAISDIVKVPPKNTWSAKYANTVLDHDELKRKPDIILIRNGLLTPINWRNIHVVTEVTSSDKMHATMKRTINNKTYLMFCTQHSRRFVPFLAVCADFIHFIVSDRQGQAIADIPYRQSGVYHALDIIRIVVALMFGSDEIIGYDSTIETLPDGEITKISADGKDYRVSSTVHAVRGIVGRSTRVWSAYDMSPDGGKKSVIIKDGWIQEGRANAEKEHLEALHRRKVRGVPVLIWGGTVQAHLPLGDSNSELHDDNTLWIRDMFSDRRAYRIHRRLVLSPVGENLSTFSSLGELIAALRDIAVGTSTTSFIYHTYTLQ
jgi:hypothetical protein